MKMKDSIVFDSGPIISLATNNLLWLMEPMKNDFKGDFIIPESVKKEVIDRPLNSKRFKFEAMQVLSLLKKGVIKSMNMAQVKSESKKLLDTANNIFKARGKYITIVHPAEIEAVALAIAQKSKAFVVDERTTRMLIESPQRIKKRMEKKLHTKIDVNKKNLNEFRKRVKGLRQIRSTEFVTIAFEKGYLNRYIPDIPNPRKELLNGVLWGLKLNGCSISRMEINRIVKMAVKR